MRNFGSWVRVGAMLAAFAAAFWACERLWAQDVGDEIVSSDEDESATGRDFYDPFYEYDVTIRDLDQISRLLRLDDEQRQSATDLLEAHRVRVQGARDKMQEFSKQLGGEHGYESANEERNTRIREQYEKYREHRIKLRDQVIDDLRAILTEEQSELWPKMDRWLFRRQQSDRGWGTTELPHFDLSLFVSQFYVKQPMPEPLQKRVEEYEEELYRVLKAQAETDHARSEELKKNPLRWDSEEARRAVQREWSWRSRQRARTFRDLNLRAFTSTISLIDDESLRVKMESAFYEQVARDPYGIQWLNQSLAEAGKLDSLTGDQRAGLEELRRSADRYLLTRRKELLTRAFAAEDALTPESPDIPMNDEWDAAGYEAMMQWEKARLDELRAMLTPEQIEKMSPPIRRPPMPELNFDE